MVRTGPRARAGDPDAGAVPGEPGTSPTRSRDDGAAASSGAAARWSSAVAASRAAESRRLPSYAAGSVDVPYTILGGQEIIARDTFWAEHSHPTHELLWNERGVSTATIGRRVWTITPGVGLWIPAGMPHSGFTPAGVWHRAAQFSTARVDPPSTAPVAVDITPLLRLLLDRLISEHLRPRSREVTDAMILDVLAPSEHELLLPVPDHPLLAPIIDALSTDPADATTLEQWAGRLGVSSRTVTRTFEAATGMSFRAWVSTARAQRAVALLAAGETIEEVALRVGFRSTSAFTAAFRRVTGLTPGQHRRESPPLGASTPEPAAPSHAP
ncbi:MULTISPECIES: helix-turn-helix domain-containing protein [Brachybacterium]|uniref:HTH-type transcriptional regulator RipA n=2 Tax=Brachybacterium TaxID=43668 RepID=A0A2A3YIF0_9MICO|nr:MULTISPECIES: AraC family transcriptional regulator [Brachybacterium]PCC34075.1 AraC family transcriptional regulator [Brachybacterium alimentarium]PCC39532.1 AraC family transcriptional regulator [Brachybacterium alimentarium]RCS64612.1 AraC family transcriptional regulator [Brachybacterium sp. JB7]RCS70992.1 AraC family transcriptional regulator [Brachybacterium alimentarium]RCS74789.1 AraC family transcriptional regulator [Brachybacterium alimentarium]